MKTSPADRNERSQIRQMVSWDGPYKISRCVPGNAYILETLEEEFFSALNSKYLKKYYTSVWVDA